CFTASPSSKWRSRGRLPNLLSKVCAHCRGVHTTAACFGVTPLYGMGYWSYMADATVRLACLSANQGRWELGIQYPAQGYPRPQWVSTSARDSSPSRRSFRYRPRLVRPSTRAASEIL